MRKYFCDECEKKLTEEELRFSLEMTGKELCSEHALNVIDNGSKGWKLANGKHYAKTHEGWIYPID